MYHSTTQIRLNKFKHLSKYFLTCVLAVQLCNVANAASQGKLGTQSTASVEISVTVNQSLSTVSPNELLLNTSSQAGLTTNKPFCIAHNGFNKNASVPYELIVDSLVAPNEKSHTLPFNIYLEDKNTDKNKQLLTEGTTITKQSRLSRGEQLVNECASTDAQLSIEKNYSAENTPSASETAGLLILLVRPN